MASPVTASTRTVYTVAIGKRRRKFHTAGAAWHALAKSLVGAKYLSARCIVDGYNQGAFSAPPTDVEWARADRCRDLFCTDGNFDADPPRLDTRKWQAYVRRVARKLRALDEYRAKAVRCG